jgi:hypothetical protein
LHASCVAGAAPAIDLAAQELVRSLAAFLGHMGKITRDPTSTTTARRLQVDFAAIVCVVVAVLKAPHALTDDTLTALAHGHPDMGPGALRLAPTAVLTVTQRLLATVFGLAVTIGIARLAATLACALIACVNGMGCLGARMPASPAISNRQERALAAVGWITIAIAVAHLATRDLALAIRAAGGRVTKPAQRVTHPAVLCRVELDLATVVHAPIAVREGALANG